MDKESILDAIYEDGLSDCDNFFSDVDMIDANQHDQFEDGELKQCNPPGNGSPKSQLQQDASPPGSGWMSLRFTNTWICCDLIFPKQITGIENDIEKVISNSKLDTQNRRCRKKRHRKSKNNRNSIGDINRFVIYTCRRLREPKSYLVWEAIRNLGVFVVKDLVKEVDAIESCRGQMTADGKRRRTGGGILWNILRSREPEAYKQIMLKGKEFEKQLRKQNGKRHATELDTKPNNKRCRMDTYDTGRNVGDNATKDVIRNSFVSGKDGKCEISLPENTWQGPPVKAWVDGIRTNKAAWENGLRSDLNIQEAELPQDLKMPIKNRIRVPVDYDDIIAEDASCLDVKEREETGHVQVAI